MVEFVAKWLNLCLSTVIFEDSNKQSHKLRIFFVCKRFASFCTYNLFESVNAFGLALHEFDK